MIDLRQKLLVALAARPGQEMTLEQIVDLFDQQGLMFILRGMVEVGEIERPKNNLYRLKR